jgi:hypothetical protein
MPEPTRRPDELLLDELTDQLDRTRRLLTGGPDEAVSRALDRIGVETGREAWLAAELAATAPLAEPGRFAEAHRLSVHALEVLDREGSRNPRVPRLGPLAPLAQAAVEFVAEYIVKSYAQSVANRMHSLYARREAQCQPATPERRDLARARTEMDRLATGFSGGGIAAPILVAAGAGIPLLASGAQSLGAIPFGNRPLLLAGLGILFVLFFAVSWALLRGAAVARRRSRLIMQQPLAALWQTVGHAGDPPEDSSAFFATISIVLTAVAWFLIPIAVAILWLLD